MRCSLLPGASAVALAARPMRWVWVSAIVAALAGVAAVPAGADGGRVPSPGAFEGTFGDDDGSVHEGGIEQIAEWGVDSGCSDGRFCPSVVMDRAQMAAWLYRVAARLYGSPGPVGEEIRFSDVAEDAWYRPYALWAVAGGVMGADGGVFDPGGSVSRADAAVMLVAAFDHLMAADLVRDLFSDVDGLSEAAVAAAEGLYHAGVTKGCSAAPLRYCPAERVTRAETASLLARAVGAAQVGLLVNEPGSAEGYVLFTPRYGPAAYLIDHLGNEVHTWEPASAIRQVKLLENGNLMGRVGRGDTASIAEINRSGVIVWKYAQPGLHHDFVPLPNGNVLLLSEAVKTPEEALAAGADPDFVSSLGLAYDYLVEVKPTGHDSGEVVWEWSVWDHLIQDYDPDRENYGAVAEHPELIDINFILYRLYNSEFRSAEDWTHGNAIDYHPGLDQIMLSPRHYGELWVIDHSTTTEEAAGAKGDLLYRWGNPWAYRAGTVEDQQLFWVHNTHWIAPGLPGEGNILVFNNGDEFQGFQRWHSSVDEIAPPLADGGAYRRGPGAAFGPAQPAWTYTAENPTDFYARFSGGAQRLPNGNTLILHGPQGTAFQVTPDGATVWKYKNPVLRNGPMHQGDAIPIRDTRETPHGPVHLLDNAMYRVEWYPPDHPGLQGLDLTPGEPLEMNRD